MQRDYTRICRVCMAEGSRDIFPRDLTDSATFGATTAAGDGRSAVPTSSNGSSTSPLDRLVEKLRYVTMMKIDENDDLPRLLCDLCIVQLNVAYNFKRQAVENDTKLRQYFIENGISSGHYNAGSPVNPVNAVRKSVRSTFVATPMPTVQRTPSRHIPVIPFVVKSEATEIDGLSDVTETVSNDPAGTPLNTSNNTNSSGSQTESVPNNFGGVSEVGTNSSMVYMINGTPSSEVEFVLNSSEPQTSRNSTINRQNLVDKEESRFMQRLNMNTPSKRADQPSEFLDESHPQNKKLKIQPSSIDLDIKEQMIKSREIRRLAIDSNFQPSIAPRQARSLKTPASGMTLRISGIQTDNRQSNKAANDSSNKISSNSNQKIAKKSDRIKSKSDSSQIKTNKSVITSTPHKINSRKMLPNPFTPNMSSSEKLLQKIRTIRGKRSTDKVFRPKINPPITKKLNKSTSTK